jgi:hypothetical protein
MQVARCTVTKDQRSKLPEDDCIDDADRSLSPWARFMRHNAMHAGLVEMKRDEFGRCARCVKLGMWKLDS